MVLYPLSVSCPAAVPQSARRTVSAWNAIESRQKEQAQSWWLVTQPDHAALSGDLAANFISTEFPRLDPDVVRGISLHDEGWARFDGDGQNGAVLQPKIEATGVPLSFLKVAPADFVRAWDASIARAEEAGPIAAILVSSHFCRIADGRTGANIDRQSDRQRIEDFLRREADRQEQRMRQQTRSHQEVETLVDMLQFCDLLSLYLCCGSQDDVEFPQKVKGRAIWLRRDGEACWLDPSPFSGGVSLGVKARRWPEGDATTLPLLLF